MTGPPAASADALGRALDTVGDRWTLLVVNELVAGPRRFGELAAALPGLAPNILTSRLRQLERAGLVSATPYSRRPLRLTYTLGEVGHELRDAIALLAAWGDRQLDGVAAAPPRHDRCGSPLEARLYCPTCDETVEIGEAEDVRYA